MPLDASSRLDSSISPMSASSSAILRASSAVTVRIGAGHTLDAQADPRQRRAQFVRAVGEQQLVRTHQLFDALRGFVEAPRERRHFVAALHLHARREVAGAELQHAGLQPREARGDAARDRIRQQREHHRDPRQQQPHVQTVQQECVPRMDDEVAAVLERHTCRSDRFA